jgi:uncharacterized protein (TIGR00369 family)
MTMSFGLVPRSTLATTSGLDLLRGMMEGRYPAPPIARLIGFELAEVDIGRVVFRGRPALEHYNPIGSVHGGYAATLLDSCMGCAVHSGLDAGIGYTTLEFKVNFVRAMTVDSGVVLAEGKVIHGGRQAAVAEGRLTDEVGRLLAHATTTCLVFPLGTGG